MCIREQKTVRIFELLLIYLVDTLYLVALYVHIVLRMTLCINFDEPTFPGYPLEKIYPFGVFISWKYSHIPLEVFPLTKIPFREFSFWEFSLATFFFAIWLLIWV